MLERCRVFLVVQDIFPNETTKFAHVILPSASWCEDEGTFTSLERRVSMVRTIKTTARHCQTQLVDLQGTGPENGARLAV